ncbi:MAG: DUF1963 domain-containing protein [Clostridia bacterium]|nr:DUF1963 domain-containing protein [Clostridia bacterium]
MSKAIGIRAKKADGAYDLGASKFFGTPTVPEAWGEDFYDTDLFFCQIRLADIATLDTENRLPHTGYLYVFLDTAEGPYQLKATVRYSPDEPCLAIDAFNSETVGYEQYTEAWLMEFYPVGEDVEGTRLFGVPSDWPFEEPHPSLLLQYDPLDSEMGFLDSLDGFLYLFFGADTADFGAVTLREEYS